MTPQAKLLFFAKSFVLLSCLKLGLPQDIEVERLKAEIQIDDLELVDACSLIAQAKKTAILNQNFYQKIVEEQKYGSLLKNHYNVLRKFVEIPTEIERNWTYQVKPGDSLLPEETWNKFVTYKNDIEALASVTKLNFTDKSLIGKSDFNHALNTERDFNTLKLIWTNWSNIFVNSEQFKLHLGYVKEAATLNEFDSVQSYWEALIDFSEGYEQADQFWEEISPFYKKLHSFVKTRLFKFYSIEAKEDIPAFLLGGELGTDWSNIADIILPHPQLHYDMQTYLKYKTVKEIYSYAEDILTDLGLKRLGRQFWDHSIFNHTQCGPEILEYCDAEYTAIITCNQTSWPVYLDSLEAALKVALNNLDYTSLPREHLRFCAIDDAVQKLGSILAINRLENDGIIVSQSENNETFKMTKLLLVALRVMPRLAYSLMVDKWRLGALEENSDLTASWWKYRKEYMGVEGGDNTEKDYLQDDKIISNQPYLSEFYGILMAFQLYTYHKEHAGDSDVIADFSQEDTFITLIKSRHSTDWPFLLSSHYSLDISATELLHYFEPLEIYFETAPVEQEALVTTTTTTTASPTTTTTTTTTTEAVVVKQEFSLDSEVVNDEPKVNSSSLNVNLESVEDDHVPMYAGIGIMVALGSVLLAGLVYKTVKKKRRTNNRRFDP